MDNVVITSYFTDNDKIKNKLYDEKIVYRDNNIDELIYKWNNSRANNNLNGIIFYDNLSSYFIERYSNSSLRFIKYERKYNLSINDERFICYFEYLLKNRYHKYILFTDLFDVWFNKNPFDLIKNDDFDIFVSHENKRIYKSPFLIEKMNLIYNSIYNEKYLMLNPGVFGGKYRNLMLLLFNISLDLILYNLPYNVNMAVFNKCCYNSYHDTEKSKLKIFSGFPLNSNFKKYEKKGDFYVAHK